MTTDAILDRLQSVRHTAEMHALLVRFVAAADDELPRLHGDPPSQLYDALLDARWLLARIAARARAEGDPPRLMEALKRTLEDRS